MSLRQESQIAGLYVSENHNPSRHWDFTGAPIAGSDELFFVLAGIALLVCVGLWIGIEGPMILIDAACEVALSIGLIRASRKMAPGDWRKVALKRTIIPFIMVLGLSMMALLHDPINCPGRDRLSEVMHQCGLFHNE